MYDVVLFIESLVVAVLIHKNTKTSDHVINIDTSDIYIILSKSYILCICVILRDKYRYIWHVYINLSKSYVLCICVRFPDKNNGIWHFSKIAVLRWHRFPLCICVRSCDKYRYIWHTYIILSKLYILCICVILRDKKTIHPTYLHAFKQT